MLQWLGDVAQKLYFELVLRPRRKALMRQFAHCGEKVSLCPHAEIADPTKLSIGAYTRIFNRPHFSCGGGLSIGKNCFIAANCTIYTTNHVWNSETMVPFDAGTEFKPVHIGNHVWIGRNVNIVAGVTVGDGAVIAMGSTVTKDVAPGQVVGGNPAKPIGTRNMETFQRLAAEESCWFGTVC